MNTESVDLRICLEDEVALLVLQKPPRSLYEKLNFDEACAVLPLNQVCGCDFGRQFLGEGRQAGDADSAKSCGFDGFDDHGDFLPRDNGIELPLFEPIDGFGAVFASGLFAQHHVATLGVNFDAVGRMASLVCGSAGCGLYYFFGFWGIIVGFDGLLDLSHWGLDSCIGLNGAVFKGDGRMASDWGRTMVLVFR